MRPRVTVANGLSPLARGTPATTMDVAKLPRFIPAGAGNTAGASLAAGQKPVYPRWRGEHSHERARVWPEFGLSPLARGTRGRIQSGQYRRRFIPAGAGNTACTRHQNSDCSVYPRWRGEHVIRNLGIHRYSGLSPLARGTPTGQRRFMRNVRFIPAGAGNTGKGIVLALNPPVYPRWRGEHTKHT